MFNTPVYDWPGPVVWLSRWMVDIDRYATRVVAVASNSSCGYNRTPIVPPKSSGSLFKHRMVCQGRVVVHDFRALHRKPSGSGRDVTLSGSSRGPAQTFPFWRAACLKACPSRVDHSSSGWPGTLMRTQTLQGLVAEDHGSLRDHR